MAAEDDQPSNPESFDSTNYSNLYLNACEHGHSNLIKFLFAEELFGKRAILQAMNKWLYTDLSGLIWSFISVHLDVNFTNFRGMSGLGLASKNGHIDIVEMLLKVPDIDVNSQDKSGMTPLLHATRRRRWKILKCLLTQQLLDVNLSDESGWTPLMVASRYGIGKIVDEFLKREDIDVNIADNERELTALILASKYGHAEAVDMLLYHESLDLSALTKTGQTQYEDALLQAYDKNHTNVISILELDDLESYENGF